MCGPVNVIFDRVSRPTTCVLCGSLVTITPNGTIYGVVVRVVHGLVHVLPCTLQGVQLTTPHHTKGRLRYQTIGHRTRCLVNYTNTFVDRTYRVFF